MKEVTNVFENTPYANVSDGQQKYVQYWMSKAYDAIEADSYAVPCVIDLYKALEKQEVVFTDEQMECEQAFVGLLCDELEKKVDWLDDRRITVKLDGEVVKSISMKDWFESRTRIDEEGIVQQITPDLENGYTHDELWEFVNSCVPQEGVESFKFATLGLTKNGINIGLQEVM
jgi:hypothetical protein